MLCIIDYGIGNLRSIAKAFEAVGANVVRSDKPADIERASHVVLPGVGAFGACADEIKKRNLVNPIREAIDAGKPFLGVCVGMQLLFDLSEEMGIHEGLGVLPGRVVRFQRVYEHTLVTTNAETQLEHDVDATRGIKVPHMGWNIVHPTRTSPLLAGLKSPAYFYFVHSYHAVAGLSSDVLGETDYGTRFPAIVHRNNVFGVQFHPEKSHDNGLLILKKFTRLPQSV